MPHVPNPLGSFPMVLRDVNKIQNPRRGELLLDYSNYELWYCKYNTGQVVSMSRDIYDRILAARLQNNDIVIADADKQTPVPGEDEVWPPSSSRKINAFYYIVRSRSSSVADDGNTDEEESGD